MTLSSVLLGVVVVYAAIVLAIALFVEGRPAWRKRVESSPYIYSLALAVYSTTWSFYGSVGLAARSGYLYAPITLGVLMSATLWWVVLRRMIRFKAERRVTSIADFVSARYDHSQAVAALVTVMALVGSLPYVALQMKAILSSLEIAATTPLDGQTLARPGWLDGTGPALVLFMSLFTILVGVRRLDPTERHQGMIAAVAVESVVKLAALSAVGAYVTWGLFDGVGDIYARVARLPFPVAIGVGDGSASAYMRWSSMLFLTMFAAVLLPRQFHVAVVENSDERHIQTAMWLFPLYVFLLQVFVMPIALGGLAYGLPREAADSFVLRLPLMSGARWLGIVAFLGGLSAGMSMIVISTVTMATMITNHILLPVLDVMPSLAALRRRLLQCRWAVVLVVLGLGYSFNVMIGESYILVNMGILSFAAALQFAPAVLGGMFWRGGTRSGALAGLCAGFAVWGWTLLLPAFVRSGWLDPNILEWGPLGGVAWMRPEALFGLELLDPLTHSLFWTLICNAGLYFVVSLITNEDGTAMGSFGDVAESSRLAAKEGNWTAHIDLESKQMALARQFSGYYPPAKAMELAERCVANAGLTDFQSIDIRQLMGLYAEAEKILAGVIGSAAAYKAMRESSLYSSRETMELSEVYAGILADLKLSPEDLAKRIDYYQEREVLLKQHADELVKANLKLMEEIAERRRAEQDLAQAEAKYRGIFENATEGLFQSSPDGHILSANPAFVRFFGYETEPEMVRDVRDSKVQLYADPADRERLLERLREESRVSGFEVLFKCRRRGKRWGALHARAILDDRGRMSHLEGILEDIHDRKKAEERILAANRYVKDVIDSMPSAVLGLDSRGRVTNWNSAAIRHLGLPETPPETPLSLYEVFAGATAYVEVFRRAMELRLPQHLAKNEREHGGQRRYEDVVVYPLAASEEAEQAVMRVDDITDRVRMEEMMVQTEKMMSVGGLAAGMAHEINNPLGGILQAVQNIERRVSDGLPANEKAAAEVGVPLATVRDYLGRRKILDMLKGIRDSGMRAAEIVTNMLEFSRRSSGEKALVDIEALLNATVELASKDYDLKKSYDFRNIRIDRRFEPQLPQVRCNPSEIEQVLLNLFRNAAQALTSEGDEAKQPTISIRTRRENHWVRIDVRDNGPGMPPEVRKRVFEPFFTTKEAGVGTGLGLSVSYFIVTTKHGGEFDVESTPGGGTTFIIRLPLDAVG